MKTNYISKTHLNNKNKFFIKRPSWIKVKAPLSNDFIETKNLVSTSNLNTVCESAACPNIGECWEKKHVTVMILGDICTRKCGFCNVKSGRPGNIDVLEPIRLAKTISKMNLKHVVITSVDRDDLKDGGASQFVKCINELRKICPDTSIEVLTPDFQRKNGALEKIIKSRPDVYNHNLETVERLYKVVRKGANYNHSLNILEKAKYLNSAVFTKSGFMLGLGESEKEVSILLDDLRNVGVDFVTIGQYLQPTKKHLSVQKYWSIEEFKKFEELAYKKGFLLASSSPLTRSSYHADKDFKKLKNIRMKLISNEIL
tara:strand:- start:14375 stop:15316 length:942 start_codon:yes stop_codon:yes gene_type:complete